MGYGDEILAAGQAQRLHEDDPLSRRVGIYDTKGRLRQHPIWDGNPIIVQTQGIPHLPLVSAPHARPYIVYPFTEATGWTFSPTFRCRDHIARIYLTDEELGLGEELRKMVGPYVLVEPHSKHPNLRWPIEYWQEMIRLNPEVTFVQHTHQGTTAELLLEGAHHVPATFREACALVQFSELYIRSESGMCHATAALRKPQITIWGACMDWDVMGGYPGQVGILNYTPGSPCGTWVACPHCADAMRGITPDVVTRTFLKALTGIQTAVRV